MGKLAKLAEQIAAVPFAEKQRVHARYDAERPGEIDRAGPVQSSIKFDDGGRQVLPNDLIVAISGKDGTSPSTATAPATIAAAQQEQTTMSTKPSVKADALRAMRERKAASGKRSTTSNGASRTKVAKSKAAKPAKKAKGKTAKSSAPRAAKEGSKTGAVKDLLLRAKGCTNREVLDATGWPTISMPATAKSLGLKLRKEKNKGEPTRYYATAA